MQATTTQIWLKTASAVLIGFGVVSALSALPALSWLGQPLIDLIFWPVDGGQTLESPEIRFMGGIAGAMMMGWGVLFWLLASRLYPRDPELARSMIIWSIAVWFVVDCEVSIMVGAPLNIVLNLLFLAAFLWPLRRGAEPANLEAEGSAS